MKDTNPGYFFHRIYNKKPHFPFRGQFEITYRCNLDCIHCYCKGVEHNDKELTTLEVKKIIDGIHKEGCLELCFTGGEPLIRHDFLEIYAYAKAKGFLITLFTNGQLLDKNLIHYLDKHSPACVEITVNGVTEATYEAITRIKGSFSKAMEIIKKLAKTNIPIILKSNCLKQNKHEIGKIKAFTEQVFGKALSGRHYFKYDPMLFPGLNRDREPCNHRLSFEELLEVKKQDLDIWKEYEKGLHNGLPDLRRDKNLLYKCDSWFQQFFINPYGQLKFCALSDKFSVNLKTVSFKEGFYKKFPGLLKEKFKTDSKCKDCNLQPVCYHCPARAYLETGDEEAPIPYYCELAKKISGQMDDYKPEAKHTNLRIKKDNAKLLKNEKSVLQ